MILSLNQREERKTENMAMSLNRVYSDFEPITEWVSEQGFDTLLVLVPGFKREELKVQLTSNGNLRVMGESHLGNNTWSQFKKEFPISSNHDSHRISAKFDNGILYIKHPKMIVPAEPQEVEEEEPKAKPTTETQKPSKPKPEPQQPERRGEQWKESKESPEPLEPKNKPEQKKQERIDQKKETGESFKQAERKQESHSRKKDNKEEIEQIQQRKTEEEKAMDSSKKHRKQSELVHGGDRKTRERKVDSYQTNIQDVVKKLRSPGNLVNLVVASLLILALALYIKYIIVSRGRTWLGISEGPED